MQSVITLTGRERENIAGQGTTSAQVDCGDHFKVVVFVETLFTHTLPECTKKKKNLSSVSLDRRAAFLQEIHHIIELFGVGNRSVTCSCFMLQHTLNCHSLTNLFSPLFYLSPLSLSNCLFFFLPVSSWSCPDTELQQTRRSQNVSHRRVRNDYQSIKVKISLLRVKQWPVLLARLKCNSAR